MPTRTTILQAVADHVDTHLVRGHAERTPDAAWYTTGAPTDELNGVVWLSDAVGAAGVRELKERLAPVPHLWNAWPELSHGRDEAAMIAAGLRFQEEEPLMARDLNTVPELDTTAVLDVTGTDRIQDWLRLWIGDPSLPDLPDMAAALRLAGPSARYLLLDTDGAAASVAAVVVTGRVAAVEHVVTRHDRRGRGFGTLVTVAALQHANAMGAERATLTASPDGITIYRRLGFEQITTVRRYA